MSSKAHKSTALVTGASSGIGKVYAERLARRGFDLIVVARDRGRLEGLAKRIEADTGRSVEVLQADLTQPSDLAKVARRLGDDPAIDLLVNNAGMGDSTQLADADVARLDQMIALNVTAVTHLAAAAAKSFAARGAGTIINIASVLALAPELFNATYNATKAFVLSLSRSMNVELAPRGVRVQAVLPGATRTEIWERAGIDESHLPAEMVMEAGEMVDAALAGLDQGELVTIPSLPDAADWKRFDEARLALGPNLSRKSAAQRYKTAARVPAHV